MARGAYAPVRERERREERQVCEPEGGKGARTPLADPSTTLRTCFFNTPRYYVRVLGNRLPTRKMEHQFRIQPKDLFVPDESGVECAEQYARHGQLRGCWCSLQLPARSTTA
ncbi:MAG: hypothetical protein VST68_07405, partial [Nitrospirota bacterium]|nr:hypothetical protein [Nitrospirota bacterium]